MNFGTRNPHHRRSALLQLALCVLGFLAAVHMIAFNGSGWTPGIGRLVEANDQTLLLVAAWGATAVQVAFQWWAAWKYLRAPTSYRTAFMISSVLALGAYPVGTAIGLYSLWVVLFVPLRPEQVAQPPGHDVA